MESALKNFEPFRLRKISCNDINKKLSFIPLNDKADVP